MICSGDLLGINAINDGEQMRYTIPAQSVDCIECTPLKDLTNTNINNNSQGLASTDSQSPPVDSNECRRQEDRHRYARMSP